MGYNYRNGIFNPEKNASKNEVIKEEVVLRKVDAACRNFINPPSLCLQTRIAHLEPDEKTSFITLLVKTLNDKYPNVTQLDMTWNELEAEQAKPLLELQHVKSLDIRYNNIGTSEDPPYELYASFEEKFPRIFQYKCSGSNFT